MNGGDGQYEDSDLPADVSDTAPTRDGYEFDGWMIDGVKVDSDNTVEDNGSDVTVVAQWTPVKQDVTPTKPDAPSKDDDNKTDNGGNGSDAPKDDNTDTPSKDDGKSNDDTDTPSDGKNDVNTPNEDKKSADTGDNKTVDVKKNVQSDQQNEHGLASTGTAVTIALAALVILVAAGATLLVAKRRHENEN